MSVEAKNSLFPSTHWSQVGLAAAMDFEQRRQAIDLLLRRYSQPLKTHLATQFRLSEDRVNDLLQSFVLQRVLLQELFTKAEQARGRFRTFLLNALDNFVYNELRNERAQKRSPSGGHVAFDELPESMEPSVPGPTAESLDSVWARAVLAEAVRRLKTECERGGRQPLWEVFDARILRPILGDEPLRSYDDLAAALGFSSPAQVYKALHTAKRMFHRVLRSVIAEYALDKEDIEREIEDWKAIFGRTRAN
jgi:RNA polymerase sigma-70 factor (ECF subfamily)